LPGSLEVSLPAPALSSQDAPRGPSRRRWLIGAAAAAACGSALLWFRYLSPDADVIPVVVLPVNALSKDPPEQSLAAALTVDLVGALSKDKQLHVTVRRPDPGQPKRGRRYYTYIDLQTADGQLKANAEIMDLDTD